MPGGIFWYIYLHRHGYDARSDVHKKPGDNSHLCMTRTYLSNCGLHGYSFLSPGKKENGMKVLFSMSLYWYFQTICKNYSNGQLLRTARIIPYACSVDDA